MRIQKVFIWLWLVVCSSYAVAQQIDTVRVFSASMQTEVENVIILPANYTQEKLFPTLYLLHGYGGNAMTWLHIHPGLPELATRYGIIIVCPDGKNSWYWDSPVDPDMRYETYLAQELVQYVDANYKTVSHGGGRAICGFSMGGHGSLWIGLRHADRFGSCGSTSGGVDIRPFPKNWEISKVLGEYEQHREQWNEHTVMQLAEHVSDTPALIFDCGTADFFYEVNEALHRKLIDRRIAHEYVSRPGKHDAAYWKNAIEYQLLFFHLFFSNAAR